MPVLPGNRPGDGAPLAALAVLALLTTLALAQDRVIDLCATDAEGISVFTLFPFLGIGALIHFPGTIPILRARRKTTQQVL